MRPGSREPSTLMHKTFDNLNFFIKAVCTLRKLRCGAPHFRSNSFTQTVTGAIYRGEIVMQFLALFEEDERKCYFQDGAPAHMATETWYFLREFFNDRMISKGLWPPRRPDLSTRTFFSGVI